LKQELGEIPVLALTATATRRVAGDIIRQLGMKKPDGFKGSFFRPNLRITAVKKGEGKPLEGRARPARNVRKDLLALLRARRGTSAIVYCMSRRGVESTAEFLAAHGVSAAPYHAGLPDATRVRNQDAFARDDVDVIGYDTFLDGIEDPEVRAETRRKTIELFRLLDGGGCRHRAACAYFDEALEPCGGSCDACTGDGVEALVGAAGAVGGAARARTSSLVDLVEATPEADALFEKLRAVRKRLADAEGVPAYIVFSDAALRGMAARRPRSEGELLQISGVGPVKLERYGKAFLEAVQEG